VIEDLFIFEDSVDPDMLFIGVFVGDILVLDRTKWVDEWLFEIKR